MPAEPSSSGGGGGGGGSSKAAFKRAVLFASLGIGEAGRVRALVSAALDAPPAGRSGEEVERLALYLAQLKLGLFERSSEELLRATCERLTAVRLQPYHKLYSSGSEGDAFFVVVDGCVEEVSDKGGPGKELVVRCSPAGTSFGEEGLDGLKRPLGVRCAAETCLLARLSRTDYAELLEEERERKTEVARQFLSGLHQLRRMPRDAMLQLAAAAELVHFDRHAVLADEGEQPDYVIIPTTDGDGMLSIRAPAGNASHGGRRPEELCVATLALRGEFVGLGLLFDDTYECYRFPCSIAARVPVDAYRVHREYVKRCFRARPVVRALRDAHYTRHSLTLDQIRRLSSDYSDAGSSGSIAAAAAGASSAVASDLVPTAGGGSKTATVPRREQPPGAERNARPMIVQVSARLKSLPWM
jgi:CRP-like cAMP-binding protein